MKRKRSTTMMALIAGASFMAGVPAAQAQGITEIVGKADAAVNQQDISTAYQLYKEATELYDEARAKKLFGDAMGYLWYRRGLCAMKVARTSSRGRDEASQAQAKTLFADAVASFNKAHKIGETIQTNPFKNVAILKLGKCKQLLKDYEGAIQSYARFLANYNKKNVKERNAFNPGQYKLDNATCYLKKEEPNLSKGGEDLAWVMQVENKTKYKIPDAAIVAGFQSYCQAVTKKVEALSKNEKSSDEIAKIEKELTTFITKNRGTITLPAFQMYAYTPHFLKLALEAQELGLDKAAFAMMGFLPNSTASKEDMERKLADLGGRPGIRDNFDTIYSAHIAKDAEIVNAKMQEGKPHEMIQNLIMANYYETEGNVRAAFAIFEMIELYHNNAPKREEYLYHLVRTSYQIGEIFKTNEYGQLYLKDFPKGSHRADVEKFMLTSLFQNGRYEECIQVANKLIPTLTSGTPQHDIALYCLGGSYFYLGQPVKATAPLEQHVKLYGKDSKTPSVYAASVQYWDAANQTYLENWEKAAVKLDKFLKDYPTPDVNAFYPLAKFDRANCYTNINDQDQKSIDTLKVVIENHPDCGVIDRAYSLRGNNHQNLEMYAEAAADYKAGLKLAQNAKHDAVESEILNYLVGMLGDDTVPSKTAEEKAAKAGNQKAAVKYYDIFWAKYSDSDYKAQVAAAGLASLRASNRGKEGLANLKQVIMQQAQVENAPGMDKAINTYSEEFLKEDGNTPLKLKGHYATDFRFRSSQVRARALVKMSLVGVYDQLRTAAIKAKDDAAAQKWSTDIKVELGEMQNFDLSKLPNYVLVSIGNNIVETSISRDQVAAAAVFFEQVIKNKNANKDNTHINVATFGLARVLVKTKDPAKMAKAYVELDKIFTKSDDKRIREKALFFMVGINSSQKKLGPTIEKAALFIKTFKTSPRRTPVRLILADAFYDQGDTSTANKHYASVVQSAMGAFKYSAPAMNRIIEINKGRDIYATWVGADDYVTATEAAFNKNVSKLTSDVKASWEKVKEFVDQNADDATVSAGRKKARAEENERRRLKGLQPLEN